MEEDVRGDGITTGFERYRLVHCALPEMALGDVDLGLGLWGKRLLAPYLISSMTGGTASAERINKHLAVAAQSRGIAMGLGSQRAAIEHSELARTYRVRDVAPDIPLFANLGAVQLNYGYGLAECQRAVEMVEADALVLHLNALQECVQPNGDTNFGGLLSKIEEICARLDVPVIAKEVGWGMSGPVARRLVEAGVAALDVAGAGGTSWSQVEMHRASDDAQHRMARAFGGWGVPTALSIQFARQEAPDLPIVASGGFGTGVEAALALALGADLVGIARGLLDAATRSAEAVIAEIDIYIETLRVAMFAAGVADLDALKAAPLLRGDQLVR
jgi:isopentenyl-diphosphate Delta-isomerase